MVFNEITSLSLSTIIIQQAHVITWCCINSFNVCFPITAARNTSLLFVIKYCILNTIRIPCLLVLVSLDVLHTLCVFVSLNCRILVNFAKSGLISKFGVNPSFFFHGGSLYIIITRFINSGHSIDLLHVPLYVHLYLHLYLVSWWVKPLIHQRYCFILHCKHEVEICRLSN